MKKLETLVEKYTEKFNVNFPLFMVGGTDEEKCEIIQKCLDTGKPVDLSFDDDPDVLY